MFDFVIGVGSNLGARSDNLALGLSRVCALSELELRGLSRVFETDPVGPPPQSRYLNAAIRVATSLDALALLDRLLAIEVALGRVRDVRWGPRTLDLDVLWSDQPVQHARLYVPHPHLHERTFALAPLLDVAPDLSSVYTPLLERLGGAPEVWGALQRGVSGISCEPSGRVVV